MSLSVMLLFEIQLLFVRWESSAFKPLSASESLLNMCLALFLACLCLLQLFFIRPETVADNMLF
jgi:hypothetical protein